MRHIILAGLLTAGLATTAQAHHPGEGEVYEAGDIIVSHAWTYENEAAAHANHVYLTLDNQGGEADRLVKAEVAFAGQGRVPGSDARLRRHLGGAGFERDQDQPGAGSDPAAQRRLDRA